MNDLMVAQPTPPLRIVSPDPERAAELAASPDGVLDFTCIVDHCGLAATRALLLLVDRYGLERVMLWHANLSAGMGRQL